MDLRSIVHAEDAPVATKPPFPTTPNDDVRTPGMDHVSNSGPRPLLSPRNSLDFGHHHARPPFPLSARTSSYSDQYAGSDIVADGQKAFGAPGMRRKDSRRPSRSEIFCEKLSQNSAARVESSHQLPYTNGGSTSNGSQDHPSFARSTAMSSSRTPTGSSPGSASGHSSFQRPTSSHSVTTPTSGKYQPGPNYTQPSPGTYDTQSRTSSYTQYPQHSVQPHTPLGPPPPGRPITSAKRESPFAHMKERTLSSGSDGYGQPLSASSITGGPPHNYGPGHFRTDGGASGGRSREDSASVSPKTQVESLPSAGLPNTSSPYATQPFENANPLKRKASDTSYQHPSMTEDQVRPKIRRSSSMTIGGLLNEAPAFHRNSQTHESVFSPPRSSSYMKGTQNNMEMIREGDLPAQGSSMKPTPNDRREDVATSASPQSHSDLARMDSQMSVDAPALDSPLNRLKSETSDAGTDLRRDHHEPSLTPLQNGKVEQTHDSPRHDARSDGFEPPTQPSPISKESSIKPQAVVKKKPPRIPPPIFAQSILKVGKNGPSLSGQAASQSIRATSLNSHTTNASTPGSSTAKLEASGAHAPAAPAKLPEVGPLGPWEPSILNVIPAEEVVKVVSDFLFGEVVMREGIGVGPPGGVASQGAVLEVEAKIGRLIDRNTNDRLRLPVMTECVVSQSDPNLRINFESSMSEAQHRALNKFLNGALVSSQSAKTKGSEATPPPNSRIPISYKHTHETDSFYELTQKGAMALPPAITSNLNPHHRNKMHVRITHDQKTGAEIARIVKARVADIDVYSPRTLFDYRISVNIEMKFDGPLKEMVEPDQRRSGKSDRNKDRMSYKHLAYQIDLTQVTPTDPQQKQTEKDHELEIEVSSAEIRRQGSLARDGQVNQYEELIRGFVDNVRVLARHCQA